MEERRPQHDLLEDDIVDHNRAGRGDMAVLGFVDVLVLRLARRLTVQGPMPLTLPLEAPPAGR